MAGKVGAPTHPVMPAAGAAPTAPAAPVPVASDAAAQSAGAAEARPPGNGEAVTTAPEAASLAAAPPPGADLLDDAERSADDVMRDLAGEPVTFDFYRAVPWLG